MNTYRVKLTREQSAFIAKQIANYPTGKVDDPNGYVFYVAKYKILPLFDDWAASIGIKADGSVWEYSTEAEYEGLRRVEDVGIFLHALMNGARGYLELQSIVPARPDNAATCEQCKGTGSIPSYPNFVCQCGGVGWKPPQQNAVTRWFSRLIAR